MRKCPECKRTYGYRKGRPQQYKFCPMCGAELKDVRKVYLTTEEWEEFNRYEHAIPWNEEIRKEVEDESF